MFRRFSMSLLLCAAIFAQIPQTIQYQGKLTDISGVGENAELDMRFRIFDVETDGDSLWAMTIADVPIVHGLFDVALGPIDLPFDEQYWLEIVVDGNVLAPRVQLTTSPYAFRAAVADSFTGGISPWTQDTMVAHWDSIRGVPAGFADGIDNTDDDDWSRSGNHLYTFNTTDSVVIGGTTAYDKLDVNGSVTIRGEGGSLRHGSGLTSNEEHIRFTGSHSDYIVSVQDGSGRIQHYWNSTTASPSNLYLADNERAWMWDISIATHPYMEFKYAPAGLAGDPITWTTHMAFDTLGNVDVLGDVTANAFIGDGSGLTGIADGDWTVSGTNMHSAVSGNVGIGVTNPNVKFQVCGDFEVVTGDCYVYVTDGSYVEGSATPRLPCDVSDGADCPDTVITTTDLGPVAYDYFFFGFGFISYVYNKTATIHPAIMRVDTTAGTVEINGDVDITGDIDVKGLAKIIGNVGVGTTSPTALLHAHGTGTGEGNVLFVGEYKVFSPGDPPTSGAGTRMMWYPDKAAFRAGRVIGTNWDKDNIGDYSVAMGNNTTASGNYSTAMGSGTTASGNYSTTMGNLTTASGYYSTAMGSGTTASGYNSIAIGFNITAPSGYETVVGRYNTTYTPNSTLVWDADDRLFVIGNGISSVSRSNAMTVLKNGNVGIGTETPTSIFHIEAYDSTIGTNDSAFVSVRNTSNADSVLTGIRFKSHSTDGNSFYKSAIVFQRTNTYGRGDLLFLNDNQGNSSNADLADVQMTIQPDGNIGVGTRTPGGKMEIYANSTGTWPQLLLNENGADYARLYFTNTDTTEFWGIVAKPTDNPSDAMMNFWYCGNRMTIRGDGNVGIGTTSPGWKLHVNGSAAKPGGGSWTDASDIRLKDVHSQFNRGLEALSNLQPVEFSYKADNPLELPSDRTYIGLIAQDVQKTIPEAIERDSKGSDYLYVNNDPIIWTMLNAIKELKAENDSLRARIEALENK